MSQEFNIIIGDGVIEEVDKFTFFNFDPNNPLPWERIIKVPDENRFPQLLKLLGMFPSTSQAMKCGWNKDIPNGWSEWKIGPKGNLRRIFILKILEWNPEWGDKEEFRKRHSREIKNVAT